MLINTIYDLVNQLSAKNSGGGYLPPDEFSTYCQRAQLQIIDQLCDYLDYNQTVITLLSDVTEVSNRTVTNRYVDMPNDYYRFVAAAGLTYDSQEKEFTQSEIEYIGKSELASRLTSKIVTPTLKYPVITEDNDGLRVDPKEVSRIKLTYIAEPPAPVWAAVDDSAVPPVFDPNYSTDFVLSTKFTSILTNYITRYFGIETDDPFLVQSTVEQLVKQ